jgi:hypothetical protein
MSFGIVSAVKSGHLKIELPVDRGAVADAVDSRSCISDHFSVGMSREGSDPGLRATPSRHWRICISTVVRRYDSPKTGMSWKT